MMYNTELQPMPEVQDAEISETVLQKAKRYGGAVVAMVAVAFTGEYEY